LAPTPEAGRQAARQFAARRHIYSEQYLAARVLREGAAEMDMVLVEGV
jgi:uncharacterized protein (DUF1330 family)